MSQTLKFCKGTCFRIDSVKDKMVYLTAFTETDEVFRKGSTTTKGVDVHSVTISVEDLLAETSSGINVVTWPGTLLKCSGANVAVMSLETKTIVVRSFKKLELRNANMLIEPQTAGAGRVCFRVEKCEPHGWILTMFPEVDNGHELEECWRTVRCSTANVPFSGLSAGDVFSCEKASVLYDAEDMDLDTEGTTVPVECRRWALPVVTKFEGGRLADICKLTLDMEPGYYFRVKQKQKEKWSLEGFQSKDGVISKGSYGKSRGAMYRIESLLFNGDLLQKELVALLGGKELMPSMAVCCDSVTVVLPQEAVAAGDAVQKLPVNCIATTMRGAKVTEQHLQEGGIRSDPAPVVPNAQKAVPQQRVTVPEKQDPEDKEAEWKRLQDAEKVLSSLDTDRISFPSRELFVLEHIAKLRSVTADTADAVRIENAVSVMRDFQKFPDDFVGAPPPPSNLEDNPFFKPKKNGKGKGKGKGKR